MSFEKRRAVEDRNKKWKGFVHAVAAADGLELRVGLMNWNLKYSKSQGGTEVAKVAGINQVYPAISGAYDAMRANTERAFEALHRHLIAGRPDVEGFIYRQMGRPLRDVMRVQAMRIVHMRSGRMAESIRATVFENVRPGRKGAMHTGQVAAGDDPLRPKASEMAG